MKKLIIIATLLVCTIAASAQNGKGNFSIAPTLGLNLTNVTDYDDMKIKPGMVAGINGEYGLSDKFGLSAGLMFSMQGCREKEGDYKYIERMNYLNIPILANYYVWKGLAVKAGIQPGFLLNAKAIEKEDGEKETEKFTDECHRFDFAIPVGISYEFSNVVIDARYNIHVTKVFKDDEGHSRNSVFQLMVGYKF